MKRIIKIIPLLIFLLASPYVNAQELTVFYKEKRKAAKVFKQESADHSKINSFVQEGLAKFKATNKPGKGKDSINLYNQKFMEEADRLFSIAKKKQEKEIEKKTPLIIPSYAYTTVLKVAKQTSLYYPQESVTNDTISRVRMNETGQKLKDEKIHYNDSEIIYINQSQRKKISALKVYRFDFKGREFLIEEELPDLQWMLTEETKKIDQYLCYKAILKNPDKQVEAWYTKDIKANHGPKGYYGLPGLILELKEDKKTVRFHKIHLAPEEGFEVRPPTEGEKITRQELEDLPAKLFNQY